MAKRKRVARWNNRTGELEVDGEPIAVVFKLLSWWNGDPLGEFAEANEFRVNSRTSARARAMVEALVKLDGVELREPTNVA